MTTPQSIFIPTSVKPLLDIWSTLENSVVAAGPWQDVDVRGEFAIVRNTWIALAAMNNDKLNAFHRSKSALQTHETLCANRVQATYNDFVKKYNNTCLAKAIALSGLSTASPEAIVLHPGDPKTAHNPLEYALTLSKFNRQYWASAIAFLHYTREAFNLPKSSYTLNGIAKNIEERYFNPLLQSATRNWLTLLVIGGTALDLQVAREQLVAPYLDGTCSCTLFLSSATYDCNQYHPTEDLQRTFLRAVNHPRSDNKYIVSESDLGL